MVEHEGRYVIGSVVKFPVHTELFEYKVKIRSKHVFSNDYTLVCKVYIRNKKSGFLRRRFIEVYEGRSGTVYHDEYVTDLVKFASEVVKTYEESVLNEVHQRVMIKESLNKFEKWDGNIEEAKSYAK